MMATAFMAFLGILIFFSASIFYAEQTHETFDRVTQAWYYTAAYGGGLSPYQSVYHAMWWGFITVCTVGYGDVFPITPAGYVVGSALMLVGVLVLALPLTLLSSTLINEVTDMKVKREDDQLVMKMNSFQNADRSTRITRGALEAESIRHKNREPVLWTESERHSDVLDLGLVDMNIICGDLCNHTRKLRKLSYETSLAAISFARLKDLESDAHTNKIYVSRYISPESDDSSSSSKTSKRSRGDSPQRATSPNIPVDVTVSRKESKSSGTSTRSRKKSRKSSSSSSSSS